MDYKKPLIQPEQIQQAIRLIRGQRVMLDRDLVALYSVTTGNLNKAVQRNSDRFPPDFMFRLTLEEAQACAGSRFQIGILKRGSMETKLFTIGFTQKSAREFFTALKEAGVKRVVDVRFESAVDAFTALSSMRLSRHAIHRQL